MYVGPMGPLGPSSRRGSVRDGQKGRGTNRDQLHSVNGVGDRA